MTVESRAPKPSKRSQRQVRRDICPNCDTANEPHHTYCANCGQHVFDHNSSLWSFIAEFTEEFARLDSKFLRTIIPLVIKPGFLTREWVLGKRVRYITPLKVYITISALAFLALGFAANSSSSGLNALGLHVNSETNGRQTELNIQPSDTQFAVLMKDWINRLQQIDPRALQDHYLNHLPTACLITVPFAALFLTLLYIRRKRYYVEHLVFILHFNAFCYLLLLIGTISKSTPFAVIAGIWAYIYLFVAMKKNYAQGWIKSVIKFWLFTTGYALLIGFAILGNVIVATYMAPKTIPPKPPSTAPKLPGKSDKPVTTHKSAHKATL